MWDGPKICLNTLHNIMHESCFFFLDFEIWPTIVIILWDSSLKRTTYRLVSVLYKGQKTLCWCTFTREMNCMWTEQQAKGETCVWVKDKTSHCSVLIKFIKNYIFIHKENSSKVPTSVFPTTFVKIKYHGDEIMFHSPSE